MDIKDYLKEKKTLIDSFLESYFSAPLNPKTLHDSMVYSLSAGGKRIRPVLCIASYEACAKDNKVKAEDIIPYASALEFIHTYSLIHDDLPAMDNDDLRRGKPTNHKVFGEGMAILAGDGLLTEAFYLLSNNTRRACQFSPYAVLKVIREIFGRYQLSHHHRGTDKNKRFHCILFLQIILHNKNLYIIFLMGILYYT